MCVVVRVGWIQGLKKDASCLFSAERVTLDEMKTFEEDQGVKELGFPIMSNCVLLRFIFH